MESSNFGSSMFPIGSSSWSPPSCHLRSLCPVSFEIVMITMHEVYRAGISSSLRSLWLSLKRSPLKVLSSVPCKKLWPKLRNQEMISRPIATTTNFGNATARLVSWRNISEFSEIRTTMPASPSICCLTCPVQTEWELLWSSVKMLSILRMSLLPVAFKVVDMNFATSRVIVPTMLVVFLPANFVPSEPIRMVYLDSVFVCEDLRSVSLRSAQLPEFRSSHLEKEILVMGT